MSRELLADLARVKAVFQLRALTLALGLRDRGSKPLAATTPKSGVVHESPGAEGNRPKAVPSYTLKGVGNG